MHRHEKTTPSLIGSTDQAMNYSGEAPGEDGHVGFRVHFHEHGPRKWKMASYFTFKYSGDKHLGKHDERVPQLFHFIY